MLCFTGGTLVPGPSLVPVLQRRTIRLLTTRKTLIILTMNQKVRTTATPPHLTQNAAAPHQVLLAAMMKLLKMVVKVEKAWRMIKQYVCFPFINIFCNYSWLILRAKIGFHAFLKCHMMLV